MTNHSAHSSDFPPAAVDALWKGRMIEAIKVVRHERNLGLKEAKDAVEAYVTTQPALRKKMETMQAEQRQGCLRWLAAVVILLALAGYWFWIRTVAP